MDVLRRGERGPPAGTMRGVSMTSASEPTVPASVPTASATPDLDAGGTRVPELSYFFPAHDEAENIEGLVEEALATLPSMADVFEIVCVDDGSSDGTAAIADRLAASHPDVVRVVHHPRNLGYGAAVRSGLAAARYPLVCFTDGDRQFRVADLGRLLRQLQSGADVVAGYRLKRADPAIRLAYARVYRFSLRLIFGLRVRDPDCACKLFRRTALEGIAVESDGAFLSAELLIKIGAHGRRIVETGVPHHPRTAGRASGADPRVVLRAVRDFWRLRLLLSFDRARALEQGRMILATSSGTPPEPTEAG
jgi:glycosyltransferase involved in cell wall biosynthesis